VPGRTIRHPLGLRAEVDIQPRVVGRHTTAQQMVRIRVDKTSESVLGRYYADAANGWVTFDGQPGFDRPFDPEVGSKSLWGKRDLPPITCTIAVARGVPVPQQEPETVIVQLSARARSDRTVVLFGASAEEIDLTIGP
jgi:hypothetical protein